MILMRLALLVLILAAAANCATPVEVSEGTITIPTYEHSGRETEPPLFHNSTLTGLYPFTTYIMPFTPDSPKNHTYRAIYVENEYLKLTYIPEFGGRIFSLFDKLRNREVFYRNDVIKPAPYNPRFSWPQSGLELTGPYDVHMLTLHGEPFWANQIVRLPDGSVSLVLGELDPVFHMNVNLTATLHPGIAALQIGVFCYNGRDARMPQMLWVNTAISATPGTRFIYPMSRTVGHTTAEIADWPLYNGIDYSLDRNNQHMLGVFGIDIYDNFQGAYQFDKDYGIFRYADRRIVQGEKLWTFGYGPGAKSHERGYTDNAGPYVELQSGRYVWDGHYEWVAPHKVEQWSEWWIPVSNTGGLTTITRDVALNLVTAPGRIDLALASTHVVPSATLEVSSKSGELLRKNIPLDPKATVRVAVPVGGPVPEALTIRVRDASGEVLLDYHRPDSPPGRKEYTPFTRPLEEGPKPVDKMTTEELAIAAEYKFKELDETGARALLAKALQQDPGYSRALLLLGIDDFRDGHYEEAVQHLETAIARDPYSDEAYYYLAMSQFALGRTDAGERNLYFIWANSAYYGAREYHLGRLALIRKKPDRAADHFRLALRANADDLLAREALILALRESGDRSGVARELDGLEALDPTNRPARAESWLLAPADGTKANLLRLLGGQSQEAIDLAAFYRKFERWADAARVLRLVEDNNRDPWGTPPVFYYTLAYCERRAGDTASANAELKKARAAAANIDRFPYRQETEAPLTEAVLLDPSDTVARFALGCLLYYQDRPKEAIAEWEAVTRIDPNNFSAHRALGLAYADQDLSLDKAATNLERAVELNPNHLRTRNDLSALYATAGRFDDQLAVLNKALARSPNDDDLVEAVIAAYLAKGDYDAAQRRITTHRFAVRHRTYSLRDKYRLMQYGLSARAFQQRDYQRALQFIEASMKPPESLGVDDFESQRSPRQQYYRGRILEALGQVSEARRAYQECIQGLDQLSGDRDSWNAENLYMVFALERLGQTDKATNVRKHFENFALVEVDARNPDQRARARYLLALVRKDQGRPADARELLTSALQAAPDFLPARLEARGDVLDPLPEGGR